LEVGVAGACGNYRGAIYVDPRIEDALPTTDLPENVATRHVRMCGVAVAPDLKSKDHDRALFIDAVDKGAKPGTLYRKETKAEEKKAMESDAVKLPLNLCIRETG
jgi:Ni,Fe-hydrogenase maturation factor